VNVECFNYFGSVVMNDVRCTHEIKSRIAMAKGTFNKKTLFTRKLDLNLRKKPHLEHDFFMVLKLGHIGEYIRNTWNFI